MATFTSSRAASTFPAAFSPGAGQLHCAYGTIEVTANPVAADIYKLCKVPAGAVIVGGTYYADDLDTNATETLEMNLGWAANGGSGTWDAIDADGLGDFGVQNGDAFATGNVSPTVGCVYPVSGVLADGDLPFFTKETTIQATCVATAATFTAGAISVAIYYVVDPSLVA
jgi:hypothetical protein